ncbi:zinc finger protein 655 isoform X10 [Cricetulus griseus]|uniref:Zinc finger protein 655 isoform X10 n=1 Tax=Cricetulus griseus TaxID=10029 RepID=A0A9J7K7N3_CRIGR|nr:zinc finger protein 655 isoform X10 [Cricetulus griseus]XP_035316514.1 zinc finger protein 655 isoform X10 [Cricetulus griseus]
MTQAPASGQSRAPRKGWHCSLRRVSVTGQSLGPPLHLGMEETPHEAAGSPRVQFQSLESQSECLSPELSFLQDTEMEQGFTGGVCDIRGCGCASYSRGMGMPGPSSEGALQRSDVRELWKRGFTGHTSPPSHHPDSLCEFLPSPESYPGKCFLWRNTCSPYGRNYQEMAQVSAFHR